MYKDKMFGKIRIIEEPFPINNRNYCKAKCTWCGKEFTTQLRIVKKGKGCQCRYNNFELLNKKFGKLIITEIVDYRTIRCRCDCGNEKVFRKYNVLTGNSKNCGCEHYKSLLDRNFKHGKSRSRIYSTYLGMKGRCYNPNEYAYEWYGNKGIKLCDEWLGENGFMNFYNWAILNGYNDSLSIERIDINKNYCPENCKWIPLSEQLLNTSKTIKIESNGNIISVKELSKKYNIPKNTIYSRIKKLNKKDLKDSEIIWER